MRGPSRRARVAWRRRASLPSLTVTAATLAVILGTYALAFHLPSVREVSGLGAGTALDYAREPFLSLPSLRQTFLAGVLSESALELLAGGEQRESRTATAPPEERRGGAGPQPTPPGEEGAIEVPVDGPVMRTVMAADKPEVRPGDTITYRITVSNTGRRSATAYSILSHVPEHTSFAAGSECDGEKVALQPNPGSASGYTLCADVAAPEAGEHPYRAEGNRPLEPGQTLTAVFSVRVDPDAPRGANLLNHAHCRGPDFSATTSNEVSTRVALS